MLVNGIWDKDWDPIQAKDSEGRFIRQSSTFRSSQISPQKGRYLLYVALICPWAHRTLITRQLKGLEEYIDIAIVEPFLTNQGWHFGDFEGSTRDPIHHCDYIHQIYTAVDPNYTGRATVPVLWDKVENKIVNNESADIVKIFNNNFSDTEHAINLRPKDLLDEIGPLNEWLYKTLNNGVYKTGFAQTQFAYEESVTAVFNTLDSLEERLSDGREFLFGDRLTESDIRLYVTLIRFDMAYYGAFKCNLRRIADYTYLQSYLERLYSIPAFKDTTNAAHIKRGYYSIKAINPNGIYPSGPAQDWLS